MNKEIMVLIFLLTGAGISILSFFMGKWMEQLKRLVQHKELIETWSDIWYKYSINFRKIFGIDAELLFLKYIEDTQPHILKLTDDIMRGETNENDIR